MRAGRQVPIAAVDADGKARPLRAKRYGHAAAVRSWQNAPGRWHESHENRHGGLGRIGSWRDYRCLCPEGSNKSPALAQTSSQEIAKAPRSKSPKLQPRARRRNLNSLQQRAGKRAPKQAQPSLRRHLASRRCFTISTRCPIRSGACCEQHRRRRHKAARSRICFRCWRRTSCSRWSSAA